MEIKAELIKPYTEKQRIDFIIEQNHNNGYEIRETETSIEAWGYTEEEKQKQERERLNLLSMTKREMFLGLYQAKGITPDMLKTQITDGVNDEANSANALSDSEKQKALIEFEYANDYYRGNPLIDVIGGQLGFTTEPLDKFFETKDYTTLLPQSDIVESESDKVSDIVTEQVTEQVEDTSLNGTVDLDEVVEKE